MAPVIKAVVRLRFYGSTLWPVNALNTFNSANFPEFNTHISLMGQFPLRLSEWSINSTAVFPDDLEYNDFYEVANLLDIINTAFASWWGISCSNWYVTVSKEFSGASVPIIKDTLKLDALAANINTLWNVYDSWYYPIWEKSIWWWNIHLFNLYKAISTTIISPSTSNSFIHLLSPIELQNQGYASNDLVYVASPGCPIYIYNAGWTATIPQLWIIWTCVWVDWTEGVEEYAQWGDFNLGIPDYDDEDGESWDEWGWGKPIDNPWWTLVWF